MVLMTLPQFGDSEEGFEDTLEKILTKLKMV